MKKKMENDMETGIIGLTGVGGVYLGYFGASLLKFQGLRYWRLVMNVWSMGVKILTRWFHCHPDTLQALEHI